MIPENKNSNTFNSEATVIGQCGDSITTKLTIGDNVITEIEQLHNGCGYTAACALVTSYIAKNLSLEEALSISPEMVIKTIVNIPEDHHHCAKLAVNSLGEAISNYYSKYNVNITYKLNKSKNMLNKVVIAADRDSNLDSFTVNLEKKLCTEVFHFSDMSSILDASKNQSILLIIKHSSFNFDSVKLVQEVIRSNAFANIAILSNISTEDFESKFEGFGILMQLPDPPNEHDTDMLCTKLNHCLKNLTGESS